MTQTADQRFQKFLNELMATIRAFMEQHDPYLYGHSNRVASGCAEFAGHLKLPPTREIDKLYFAGLLHDVGMVYVPKRILSKRTRLNVKEMQVVRGHPHLSGTVLAHLSLVKEILPAIRHHHENVNGSGYPDGLQGPDIPLGAKIMALVDSYDALTTDRPYRRARSSQEAMDLIVEESGRRFDPELTAAFVQYRQKCDPGLHNPFEAPPKPQKGRAKTPKKPPLDIGETIRKIVAKAGRGDVELPVLPQVVGEVDTVIHNPASSAENLAAVIEKDAAISLKLISVANSPYYRGVEPISTVRAAIPRLGYRETQNIVSAIACRNIYRVKHPKFKQLMENVWLHSLAAGFAARGMSRELSLQDNEQFFFLGVVHDIGKVILIQSLAEKVNRRQPVAMAEVRSAIVSAHGDLSGSLLKQWRLPAEFARAVARHEKGGLTSNSDQVMVLLSLADSLAASVGYRVFDQDPPVRISELETPALLNLPVEAVDALVKDVRKFMGEAARFF